MSSRAALASSCPSECQELRALKETVRQDRIRTQREMAAQKRAEEERQEINDKKLDAILEEVQWLKKFMVEWVGAGKKR